jgi:TetR/AcrR family transcriptional regulator, transcriptional repressor for nem operon
VANSVEAPEAGARPAGRRAGKRERLVTAAQQVFHRHGVEKATLADIAAAAGVPLGNVYYYFRTKDALVSAVIERYGRSYDVMSAELDQHEQPADRLRALLRALTSRREQLASYGCPIGSLSTELDKRDGVLRTEAAGVLSSIIDWAEPQFQAMGRDDARELAVALIASYEGITVLASALRDPSLITAEAERLERWIDSLAPSAG